MRRPLRLAPLALAAILAVPADPAAAQTPPPAGGAEKPAGVTESAKPELDATGQRLASAAKALEAQAQVLVDEYRKALEKRISQLAAGHPTLKRLHDAGIFNMDGLTAGVADDPLSALPEFRRVYENLEHTAQSYVTQYGGVARQKAEAAAVDYLRKIVEAQTIYREEDKDGNGILEYAIHFADLGKLGLLHIPPAKKDDKFIVVEGYKFRIIRGDTNDWAVDGAPYKPGESGDVWLFVDQTGIIRAEKGKPAGQSSPPYKADK
jgi:hypothetical protein